MWPIRTRKGRDGTAWQGHSWAWRGSCRGRVKWGNSRLYSRGSCCGRGEGGWALRGSGAIGGRGVDRRGGSVGDAGRSEAGKKGGDVAGIGDGESAGRAVVRQRETKERGSDRVSFYVV